jgi:hypothetical protein
MNTEYKAFGTISEQIFRQSRGEMRVLYGITTYKLGSRRGGRCEGYLEGKRIE